MKLNWKCPQCGKTNKGSVLCMNMDCDYEQSFLSWSFKVSPLNGLLLIFIAVAFVFCILNLFSPPLTIKRFYVP